MRDAARCTRLLPLALALAALAAAPAWAGAPFRTDDPGTVDAGHWEFDLTSSGTRNRAGWQGTAPAVEADYGILPGIQVHILLPHGYARPAGGKATSALGDLELGVKIRLLDPPEGSWLPRIAFYPLVEVPVGNRKLGFSTGHAQVFLPLWLQKDFGDWTVFGGGGWWINPGAGNRDYGYAGLGITRPVTEQLRLGVEIFHQTANVAGGKSTTGINVGGAYDINENWHLLGAIGTGLQNRRDTNEFSYYLGLQLTF